MNQEEEAEKAMTKVRALARSHRAAEETLTEEFEGAVDRLVGETSVSENVRIMTAHLRDQHPTRVTVIQVIQYDGGTQYDALLESLHDGRWESTQLNPEDAQDALWLLGVCTRPQD